MFAATADGFVTSTTLNSITITVAGGVFVVDGNSQEDMYLARGTTFFIIKMLQLMMGIHL